MKKSVKKTFSKKKTFKSMKLKLLKGKTKKLYIKEKKYNLVE